jgi:DNA invertase Pin-like site-specific DNA recombinase
MSQRLAFSYLRFSTYQQAKGGSRKRQLDLAEAFCKRRGWKLDNSLRFEDLGVSAFHGANAATGALAVFLQAVQSGRVPRGSVLLVESLDRLSREQVRKAMALFLAIMDAGVSVQTFDPEREYTPDDKEPWAIIEPLLIFARANEESRIKSSRGLYVWQQRRRRAELEGAPVMRTGPAWLRWGASTGSWELIPDRVATVQRICELSIEGYGSTTIAKLLVSEGRKPFGPSSCWGAGYVRKILRDPAAMGTFQPRRMEGKALRPIGNPIPGYFPAAVDEETWRQASERHLDRRWKRGKAGRCGASLFPGLLFNAVTKGTMCRLRITKPRGGVYEYLVPGADADRAHGGRGLTFPYPLLERELLRCLRELGPREVLGKRGSTEGNHLLPKVTQELHEVKATLQTVQELLTTNVAARELLRKAEVRLRQKCLALQRGLTLLKRGQGEPPALGEVKALIAELESCDRQERDRLRCLLRGKLPDLVSAIWVLVAGNRTAKVAHVQICFNTGAVRYLQVIHSPKGQAPVFRCLEQVDLREWHPGEL